MVATFEEDEIAIETVGASVAKIYPNPTDGILYVEMDNYAPLRNIDVFDVFGRNVLPVHPPFRGGLEGLDISNLPSGMYFVRVATETEAVVRKVVKR